MSGDDVAAAAAVAAQFEAERGRLVAVARRLLGSRAEAEDAVQDAWLRLDRHRRQPGATDIDNLPGWLTTVVGRLCLDRLRAPARRTTIAWDDVEVRPDDGRGPAEEAEHADSVGLALLVVLAELSPAERLALVMHDVFGLPFGEVAEVIGTSRDAAKKAASRARLKVRGSGPGADGHRSGAAHRRVVDAFLEAARSGDLTGLTAVLHPDVVLRTDTPGGRVVVVGSTEVAGRARVFAGRAASTVPVRVDGLCGVVSTGADGSPAALMVFVVEHEHIVGVVALADPARLAALHLPR